MRRSRGFTLVELMISLGLASLVAIGMLTLVRAQLRAYDLNDAVVKAQQNARAGLEYVESQLRRACGGISAGSVAVFLPGITPFTKQCVTLYDSASLSGGTFGTSGTTGADAIEIVYAMPNSISSYGAITALSFGTTAPSVTVSEMGGFAVGDLVLVTNFSAAYLFKISTINGGATPATGAGPIAFGTVTAAPTTVAYQPITYGGAKYAPSIGDALIKATSMAIYFVPGVGLTAGQLYVDPDGMAGADHTDAQPLIDGVSDFQLAVGIDLSTVAPANGTPSDGIITEAAARSLNNDEWIGNYAGETLPAAPWNPTPAAAPMLLQIRATMLVRTTNTYAEGVANPGPYEDGATITAANSQGRYPRYRAMRTVVAPRQWNLTE